MGIVKKEGEAENDAIADELEALFNNAESYANLKSWKRHGTGRVIKAEEGANEYKNEKESK